MKKPELLAPMGNWTMLKAAVDAGTDAVYFGIKNLNMRSTAQNFSVEELPKIVSFCHENSVKAYLTLNIIIFDDEIKEVEETLKTAKKAGIDMVICWDMSVLSIAKKIENSNLPFNTSFCIKLRSSQVFQKIWCQKNGFCKGMQFRAD